MLTRWNDYYGWPDLQRSFDRMAELHHQLDRILGGSDVTSSLRSGWPRTQVTDLGNEYYLRMEVPGFTQEDLQVDLEKETLTIRGKRKLTPPEGYSVHRRERSAMEFAQSFSLPGRVDAEKVRANINNGVLELSLAKAAEDQPRRIQIGS